VIPRRVFAVLTTLLAVFTVASCIFLAFQTLFAALGDITAARVGLWISRSCLALLAVTVVLLVGALGWNAMRSPDDRQQ
jgi:hypothetical protein